MNPRQINIADYTYELPNDKIARFPLEQRDQSKLLVYQNGTIRDELFTALPSYIPEQSLMVFNNTRVIHARLLFQRATGAQIEVFCIEPLQHLDYQLAFASTEHCSWKCMVGNAKRWKNGERLTKLITTPTGNIELSVTRDDKTEDLIVVHFIWNNTRYTFAEILHHGGILPLPPYLNRNSEMSDEERYQTVYAKVQGSVAAPTAGLHFTETIFEQLSAKNIQCDEVTLHVGAGTFKPVKSETLEGHEMHEETIFVTLSTLQHIYTALSNNHSIIAVGTTGTRTLESLYWHGVKVLQGQTDPTLSVQQWDPYETEDIGVSPKDAIAAIITQLEQNQLSALQGSTQIIIAPGYTFKLVDILVTNFHQPENTLILLIAAFVGKNWRTVYNHALARNYRFLSYGDSSVLFRE